MDTVHMQLRLPSEKLARLQDVQLNCSTRRGREQEGNLVSDRQSSPCLCGGQTGTSNSSPSNRVVQGS